MRTEFLTAAVLLVCDQVTKALARAGVLSGGLFFHTQNPGGSLGMFPEANAALVVLSVFAALLLVVAVVRHSYPESSAYAIVLAGVVGNGIDRVILSSVTDFIRFFDIFIFNIADLCISVGVVFLLLYELPWFQELFA